ncbi:hypothetical protein PR350_26600, partial [Mycobacterium marinum]|nr:hypothetical protein [Mycobacterium marinum]
TITIPQIPLTIGGGGILNIPIAGAITGLTVQPFMVHGVGTSTTGIPLDLQVTILGADTNEIGVDVHIPKPIDKDVTVPIPSIPVLNLGVTIDNEIGAIVAPEIAINPINFNKFMIGNEDSPLTVHIGGGAGPVTIPVFHLSPTPGFGNSGGAPSSGFFNSGDGVSGFGNFGATVSGWGNVASHASGFENFGTGLSGFTNVGDVLSGLKNTNSSGLGTSGVGNVGDSLSGLFYAGPDRMSIFNAGLGNLGVGNVGFASVGDGNVGGGNLGDGNVGFGNV